MKKGMVVHFKNDSERRAFIEDKENWYSSDDEDVVPVRTYTMMIDGATFVSIVPLQEVPHFDYETRKGYTSIEYLHPAEYVGKGGIRISMLKEGKDGTWYMGEPMSKSQIVQWMKEQEKDEDSLFQK